MKLATNRRLRKGLRILLIVLLAVFAVGFLLPTVLTLTNAFMSGEELAEHYGPAFESLEQSGSYMGETVQLQLIPKDFTLRQFVVVLFQSPDYLLKFWNSMILVVPIVLGQALIASMAAYSLARVRNRARSVLFFFYIMLMLTPFQVTLVPNYLVSKWLGVLGTRWAVIFPGIFAPFSVFLLARFMQRIPSVQLEAAQLDGAGEWRLFTRICMPQCRGVLYSVMILLFLDYWNMVEQPLVLLEEPAQYPLSIFLSEINSQDVAIAFAAAVIYMVPPLLLFLHGEKHLVAGIAQSGSFAVAEEKPRRRRWVVVLAGVFFGALLFLTLFFQPILEHFVPRVTMGIATRQTVYEVTFDQVLPETAVFRDDEGAYVLVAEEQESAFGTRYLAKRFPVTELARDGQLVAIQSELTGWENVILTYSSPPEEGQYVQPETEDSFAPY